jgi:hypothetical protein
VTIAAIPVAAAPWRRGGAAASDVAAGRWAMDATPGGQRPVRRAPGLASN